MLSKRFRRGLLNCSGMVWSRLAFRSDKVVGRGLCFRVGGMVCRGYVLRSDRWLFSGGIVFCRSGDVRCRVVLKSCGGRLCLMCRRR